MVQKPKFVLLTFTKEHVFAFSDSGLWASYSLNHVRELGKDFFRVDGYTFTLVDYEGNLLPWYKGKEVLFSGYAKVSQTGE